MHSTLNPKQTDGLHDFIEVAPDVVLVAPTDEELSNLAHDAVRYPWDPQAHTGSDIAAGPPVPPVDTTFRPAAVNDVLVPGHRRSIGGRALRAFTALLLAASIGVAAAAWQSYGDAAKQVIAKWAPQFVLTSSLPLEKPELPAQPTPPADQATAANAAAPQPAPLAPTAPQGMAPTAAALSPESAQLLQSMARDLANAGQEIEQLKASIAQLKASQQQMSRDIAKASEAKASEAKASEAKASEQNLRPGISAPAPRSAAAPARRPMPRLPPPQAAAAPTLPQAAAPLVPRQPEPQPQATQTLADPELSSVPRPPMPVR
jgi:hypothetical protein